MVVCDVLGLLMDFSRLELSVRLHKGTLLSDIAN
jgi:hypothetical protein